CLRRSRGDRCPTVKAESPALSTLETNMIQETCKATEERVKGTGDLDLFVRSWRPGGAARGVISLVPGLNAHSGSYAWPAEQFAASGFAAYAVDLRGRGQSDGERFYVDTFAD